MTKTISKIYHNGVQYDIAAQGGGATVTPNVELLVVGWGWGGWWCSAYGNQVWWWGGGWWVVYCPRYETSSNSYSVVIGWWWSGGAWEKAWCNWWDSCFWTIKACWWWWGGNYSEAAHSWWSWWWAGENSRWTGWSSVGSNFGNSWWNVCCYAKWWAGWGWAGWPWESMFLVSSSSCYWFWWNWWAGLPSCISWNIKYYWAWWWGWACWCCSCFPCFWLWWCWWGNGGLNWRIPTAWYCCWWWWWGWAPRSWCGPKAWAAWVVIARYKTDWSMWINCATWWCVYTCGDYTIHCFTSNGTFCIVS